MNRDSRAGRPAALLAPAALTWALALALSVPAPSLLSAAVGADSWEPVRRLMAESRKERRAAAKEIVELGDPARSLVPGMVDALFFTPRNQRRELLETLRELTGEDLESYRDWVELLGSREDLAPADGYLEWKVSLFERIDERYDAILYPGAPARIRLEEVVWGGVRIAGIPAVVDPRMVPASEAEWMLPDERVFGVELGGEARAYPVRILSWHEMLNDTVGGQPVALSYCTLCGSGILYSTATPGGEPYSLGTSGLLYRSNKLMFDSQTLTLWSNLTGEPVVGRLAGTRAALEMLPMTLTPWKEWVGRHPETTVIDLEWARKTYAAYGFAYRPGAADQARQGVSFPVWQRSDALDDDAEIYALRLGAAAKAWSLEPLLELGLLHDELGGVPLVLVAEESGAVRAYESGGRRFRRAGAGLVDGDGGEWRITEAGLVAEAEGETSVEVAALPRVPGHVAFWFGWFGFYPETEVWDG